MFPDIACAHVTAELVRRLCSHLFEVNDQTFIARFTGSGTEHELLCEACSHLADMSTVPVRYICDKCFSNFEDDQVDYWSGVIGQPEIPKRPSSLRFKHDVVTLPSLVGEQLADMQPVGASSNLWNALTRSGKILSIDLSNSSIGPLAELPGGVLDLSARTALHLSPDGTLAAIVNVYGEHGVVLDLGSGAPIMPLQRDDYFSGVTFFPIAFAVLDGRTILVHASAWNRLEISDARTGTLLTDRAPTTWRRGEDGPLPHYQNYFRGRLSVSPDQEKIVSSSWGWQPFGIVELWDLRRWLDESPWESDDGPSMRRICWRDNHFDDPLCWINDHTLAVWGCGPHQASIPAVRIFDATSGCLSRWFPGPDVAEREPPATPRAPSIGPDKWSGYLLEPHPLLLFDDFLFSISKLNGISAWDVATGERLLHDGDCRPDRYHPGGKQFLTALPNWTFQISRLS